MVAFGVFRDVGVPVAPPLVPLLDLQAGCAI